MSKVNVDRKLNRTVSAYSATSHSVTIGNRVVNFPDIQYCQKFEEISGDIDCSLETAVYSFPSKLPCIFVFIEKLLQIYRKEHIYDSISNNS